MPDYRVQVVGLRALRATLRRARADLADLKAANAKAAAIVAAESARRAPKRRGRLAATVRGNRAIGKAVIAAGGTRAPYAPVVYWGWPARRIKANEFIARAAIATQPVWLPAYARDVQAALDKVHGA